MFWLFFWPRGTWTPSSLTWDRTDTHCFRWQSLNHWPPLTLMCFFPGQWLSNELFFVFFFKFFFFFLMWNILKSLLSLSKYCFCFMFRFVLEWGCEACGILVPRPGIDPTSLVLEGEVPTTGPPGKSHGLFFGCGLGDIYLDSCWVTWFMEGWTLVWPWYLLSLKPTLRSILTCRLHCADVLCCWWERGGN